MLVELLALKVVARHSDMVVSHSLSKIIVIQMKKLNFSNMKNINKAANIWAAIAAGRKVFRNQMDQTHEIKVRALEYALETEFPTYHKFGNDLSSMTENLCDSKRFVQECKDLELEPSIVAQHVIFAGQKVFNQVRDSGVKVHFGKQLVREFNKPLYVEEFK